MSETNNIPTCPACGKERHDLMACPRVRSIEFDTTSTLAQLMPNGSCRREIKRIEFFPPQA